MNGWARLAVGLGLGAVAVVAAIFWVYLIVALRSKRPALLKPIRRLNRGLWNKLAMRSAGRPGASAAVVHHMGRRSGAPYRTPVGVIESGDEFLIVLPYGTEPDWLKNLVSAGSGVLVDGGTAYQVTDPRVVPTDDRAEVFTTGQRRTLKLFGTDQLLRLRRVGPTETGSP